VLAGEGSADDVDALLLDLDHLVEAARWNGSPL
jgi:hypothetical protein